MFRRRPPPDPVPDQLIRRVIDEQVALASRLDTDRLERLVGLTRELLHSKRWEGAGDFEVPDRARITIAANAAIPILSFDTWPYRQVSAIIVRPTSVRSTSQRTGPAGGTFTDEQMHTAGEAMPNSGPVALAWDVVERESRHPLGGANVVIHEFAHKIDMNDGYADGIPPLRGEALERWIELLDEEFIGGGTRPSDEVLRPYAWASPAEYFAVATETFFCRPQALAEHKPLVYAALSELYQQDPATA